jgi:hypothetical protein
MGNRRAEIHDMKRLERLCLEQAERCVLAESRRALRTMAGNYRAVAVGLERHPAPVVRAVAFDRRRRKSLVISRGLTGHPFRHTH